MGSTASAEVAAVKKDIDGAIRYTEKIVAAFDRVAVGAVENYQKSAPVQKNTAEGGVQYQTKTSHYDYTKSFADQLTDFQNGAFPERDTLTIRETPEV